MDSLSVKMGAYIGYGSPICCSECLRKRILVPLGVSGFDFGRPMTPFGSAAVHGTTCCLASGLQSASAGFAKRKQYAGTLRPKGMLDGAPTSARA